MGSDGGGIEGSNSVGTSGRSVVAVVVTGANTVVISVDVGVGGVGGVGVVVGGGVGGTVSSVVNTGGVTGGSAVGRANSRSSTSVGELVACGFFSSTELRFCIKSLISKLLFSPASLSKLSRKDTCGSN